MHTPEGVLVAMRKDEGGEPMSNRLAMPTSAMPFWMHDAEGCVGYFALGHYPISDPISPTWEMQHELEVGAPREARESSRR